MAHLADNGMFVSLARMLLIALPHTDTSHGKEASSAEGIAAQLVARYMGARIESRKFEGHRVWALLAVPGLMQRSVILPKLASHIATASMTTLSRCSSAQAAGIVNSAAVRLGYTCRTEARHDGCCACARVQCALQMLATLLHGVLALRGLGKQFTGPQALAFMRFSRLVVAMLPQAAREELAKALVSTAASTTRCAAVPASSFCVTDASAQQGEQIMLDTSGAVHMKGWHLPQLPPVSNHRRGNSADAAASSADAAISASFQKVLLPLGALHGDVTGGLVTAALSDASGGYVVDVNLRRIASWDAAAWLATLLGLSKARGSASPAQQLELAWSAGNCAVCAALWQYALQLDAAQEHFMASVSSPASASDEGWLPAAPVPSCLLPLLVLSRLHARFLLTASNEAIFAGDQRQQTLLNLGGGSAASVTLFIPFIRDALYAAFLSSSRGAAGARQMSDVAAEAYRCFKLVVGRYLCQLHERSSGEDRMRSAAPLFQVRHLQRSELHQEVKVALSVGTNGGTNSIFADEMDDEDEMDQDGGDDAAAASSGMVYIDMLQYAPCVIPFEDRALVFQALIFRDRERDMMDEDRTSAPEMPFGSAGRLRRHLRVRRDRLFEDGFDAIRDMPAADLKRRLHLQFVNSLGEVEAGVDGGGLFKDFMDGLIKEAFQPVRGLFCATEEGELYPNPAAHLADSESHAVLRFLGAMLGKAMYEGIIVEVPLARFFLKKIRGDACDVNDLPSLDKQLYANLVNLAQYDGPLEDLGLNFTIRSNAYGREQEVDLLTGGAEVPVTHANREVYTMLVADFRLNREIAAPSNAFLAGLTSMIQPQWLRMFNDRELQQLIAGGEGGLDVDDLVSHVVLGGGLHADHPLIHSLWMVLRTFDDEQKAKFLRFVTGCSRPPLLGFKHLQPPFAINMRGHVGAQNDETALPTASTCFNLLKLPPYPTPEVMRAKLLTAIDSGAGFDLS